MVLGNVHTPPATQSPPRSFGSRAARVLEAVGFLLLLLVVAMRPLLSETYDSQRTPIDLATGLPEITTPATTAWLDMMIWISATAWAASACIRRKRWQWTGVEVGWTMLIVGAVISTWTASNRRLALNASCDWLTCIVLLMTTAQWARHRWRAVLVLIVVVASGLTSAARCGMQKGVEFRETQAQYEQNKEDFWRRQGIDPDAPEAKLYERRLAAREATGFFPFSNIQGIGLSLAGFAALALMGAVRKQGYRKAALAVIAAVPFATIVLTGSMGALAATAVGLVLWWGLGRWQALWKRHWHAAFLVGWLVVMLGAAGLVTLGSVRGGLPGSSLNFRWQYWKVTSWIIRDHFWTGTGALNFDRTYLAYKPIECPEEIKDPHDFVLSAAAQWGVLGAVGWIICLIGGSWVWLRNEAYPGSRGLADSSARKDKDIAAPRCILAMIPTFLVFRFVILHPLWETGPSGRAFVVFDLGMYGLLWCLAALGLTYLITRNGKRAPRDDCPPDVPTVPQAVPDRIAVACGLVAFGLHNVISFSMFYPGTLTMFAALGGVLLARPVSADERDHAYGMCSVPLVVAIIAVAAFAWWIFLPVTRSAHWMRVGRNAAGADAVHAFECASAADPLDPTPEVERAMCYAARGDTASLGRALEALHEAILRDPKFLVLHRYRWQLLLMRYEQGGSVSDLLAAVGAARHCVTLYPASPECHLDLARLLDKAARLWQSPLLQNEALAEYAEALRLNAARPGTDEVRRWSPSRVARIRQCIQSLRALPLTHTSPGP